MEEIRNCINGEVNRITNEIFCNEKNECCKFIEDCKIKKHMKIFNEVNLASNPYCPHCGKRKVMKGDGTLELLCEC